MTNFREIDGLDCPYCGADLMNLADDLIGEESGDCSSREECPGCGVQVDIDVEVIYKIKVSVEIKEEDYGS